MTDFLSTIGDIAVIYDGPHATPKKTEVGPYFLSISSLSQGRLDLSKSAHLNEMDFEKWTKRVTPEKGDLLFSYETRLGEVALMPNGVKACLGRRMGLLRPKKDKVISEYFLYAYLSPYFQQVIATNTITGATVDRIALSEMSKFPIRIPPIQEQRKIAGLLRAIDKKIELNNKINTELEAMVKLIYNYWFVQFNFPDANGKPYKSSGGKMVYNETLKREIPDGWGVGTLLDIANFTNGIACQKYRPDKSEPFYNVIKIREMGAGFTEKSEVVSHKIPSKVIVNNGDVLFSWSATLEVKIWTGGVGGLNQHIFKVTSSKYPRTYYYFEVLQYLQHFKMIAELRKTTMGHITQDHLKQSRISIPPAELIESLHKKIDPILNRVIKGMEENQALSELRDWLLPMLMNGQVTVNSSTKENADG